MRWPTLGACRSPTSPKTTPGDPSAARAAEHEALLGVLAHELRTPITTIYAGSAVLARDDDLLPAMRRELASDVYAEAARLFRAVEDLLVLTRLEHDAVRVTREPISLIRAVDAGDADRSRHGGRGCSVMLRLDGTPPPAAADPNALAHALRNLIAQHRVARGRRRRSRDRRRRRRTSGSSAGCSTGPGPSRRDDRATCSSCRRPTRARRAAARASRCTSPAG